MTIQTSIYSCILGLAVGDALGVPYEFLRRDQAAAAELTHMTASRYYHQQPAGAWSDDTAMTLAAMDSLTRCGGFDGEDTMRAFLDWYDNAAYTSTGETFGVGGTVYRALLTAKNGIPALQCGRGRIRDNGNGSLMRIAPAALYCAFKELPREDEVQLLADASAITHAHEISKLGCLIYSVFLKALIRGADKEEAYRLCCAEDYTRCYSPEAAAAYGRILNGTLPALEPWDLAESGYVVDTLEAALWAVLHGHSYEESVSAAIRLGYDTDTVAAVTGSLCGVLYGVEGIPLAWWEELLRREDLEELCERFAESLA